MKSEEEYLRIYDLYCEMSGELVSQIVGCEWTSDFILHEVKYLYDGFISNFKNIDFCKLSQKTLIEMGFRRFNDKILLPLWAFHCLSDGVELLNLSNNIVIVGSEEISLNMNVRFGTIGCGFSIQSLRDGKFENLLI